MLTQAIIQLLKDTAHIEMSVSKLCKMYFRFYMFSLRVIYINPNFKCLMHDKILIYL